MSGRVLKLTWGCPQHKRVQMERSLLDQITIASSVCMGQKSEDRDRQIMHDMGMRRDGDGMMGMRDMSDGSNMSGDNFIFIF